MSSTKIVYLSFEVRGDVDVHQLLADAFHEREQDAVIELCHAVADIQEQPHIASMGMFATPASIADLQAQIANLSNGTERAIASLFMALTWNLVASLMEHQQDG